MIFFKNTSKNNTFLFIFLLFFGMLLISTSLINASYYDNPPTGKYFFIKSVKTGRVDRGYWDQGGRPKRYKKGANLKVWSKDRTFNKDQQFRFIPAGNGYYYIRSANEGYIDIAGGKNSNGVNVGIWRFHGKSNQKFRFKYLSGGRWKIYTPYRRIICLKGKNYSNGTNIHIWRDHNVSTAQWYFVDARTNKIYKKKRNIIKNTTPPVSKKSSNSIYNLKSGEEFVYGKIGLDKKDNKRYTFAVVRKPNTNKDVYKRRFDPYGPRPILGPGTMKKYKKLKSYDKYDYWVIFNGKKFGPYDRIMEMNGDNPNIDSWVSRDGKKISFAAVRGKKYQAIIANRPSAKFWTIFQKPVFDPKSEKNFYAMEWSRDNFRIFNNGKIVKKNLKDVKLIKFSENGENFIYAAASNYKKKYYIYLNNKKIAGPFNFVRKVGFLPGTNKIYYNAYNRVNGGVNHKIVLGNKEVDIPKQTEAIMYINNSNIAIKTSKKVKNPPKNNRYGRKIIQIYIYNISGDILFTHDKYNYNAAIRKVNNNYWYRTFDENGNVLIIDPLGEINTKIKKPNNRHLTTKWYITPDDNVYLFYKKPHPNGSIYSMGKYDLITIINGKREKLTDYNYNRVEMFDFNPDNGKINSLLSYRTKPGWGTYNITIINGSNHINTKGNIGNMETDLHFAKNSNDVYWICRYPNPKGSKIRKYTQWKLFKNSKALTDKSSKFFGSISLSNDGNRYASLLLKLYWPINKVFEKDPLLIIDGEPKMGNFGAPVYSEKENKFLVLEEKNNKIFIRKF